MKETSLGVIKGIVSDLGGTTKAKTVLQALKDLATAIASGGGGGTVADDSITTEMLQDGSVTAEKLDGSSFYEYFVVDIGAGCMHDILCSVDQNTQSILRGLGLGSFALSPKELHNVGAINLWFADTRFRLCWVDSGSGSLEVAPVGFAGDLLTETIVMYAKGVSTMVSGRLGEDDSWTIESL